MKKRKILGIIGGVGPLATMLIGEKIVRLTEAKKDQDHIHSIITNNSQIPDRTRFILKQSKEDPVPVIVKDAKRLQKAGAEILILPCNTAHSFYDRIQRKIDLPLIHMIQETIKCAKQTGAKKIGILATTGTIATEIYQKECERVGIDWLIPDDKTQALVMSLIYDHVKAGVPIDPKKWKAIEKQMIAFGCETLILGCTELSIVKDVLHLDHCIDSLTVLAKSAIRKCGYRVKSSI